ncbi:hypothetical protein NGC89_02575 [Staphylococcus xylosus]|uniref:hypothetical protein n=1 Tax=Staphylococcus xylosus TaxID=1288 RepID=UPI002DBC15E3|nr:hypothetical protein [Staphylococcus xylosus]MEB7800351.1 hypothetical protein [Staphylococcus xylosus]
MKVGISKNSRKKFNRVIYTGKVATTADLLKEGYKFVTYSGEVYINLQNGFLIKRTHKKENAQYVKKFIEITAIMNSVRSVYNQYNQLLFKRNPRTKQLVKIRFTNKK